MGNGATTCAHCHNIDHRNSGGVSLHSAFIGKLGLTVFNQADINAGTSHIKGNNFIQITLLANVNGTNNAGRGPGNRSLNRTIDRLFDRDDRTVGLGHIRRYSNTGFLDRIFKVVYIFFHYWAEICVQDSSAHAGVFTKFSNQVVGCRNIHSRILFFNDLLDAIFMNRIDEREQCAHRNGLCTHFLEEAHRITNTVFV